MLLYLLIGLVLYLWVVGAFMIFNVVNNLAEAPIDEDKYLFYFAVCMWPFTFLVMLTYIIGAKIKGD